MNISQIKKLLIDDADYWGAPMTESRLNSFTQELRGHFPDEILKAMIHFRNEAGRTRMPMPADLKEQMSGFISAEEAFAMLPRREEDSVVWTKEAAIAYGACRDLIIAGDFYGARQAFEIAYNKAVAESKAAGKKAVWEASLGFEKLGREKAVAEAIDKNRIKVSHALDWVPSLKLTEPMQKKLELEGANHLLLTSSRKEEPDDGPVSEEEMEKNRVRVKELLASLDSKKIEN